MVNYEGDRCNGQRQEDVKEVVNHNSLKNSKRLNVFYHRVTLKLKTETFNNLHS